MINHMQKLNLDCITLSSQAEWKKHKNMLTKKIKETKITQLKEAQIMTKPVEQHMVLADN